HFKYLEAKIYASSFALVVEYISWQTQNELIVGSDKYDVVSTIKAPCVGGEYTYGNNFYNFSIDGCVFMASSSIKANVIEYQQSNVGFIGLKSSIGAGMVVSPNKAEIGLKVPVIFSSQKLTEPPSDAPECSGGCNIEQPSAVN